MTEDEATSAALGGVKEILLVPFSNPKAYKVTNGVYPVWKKCYS